MATNTRTEHHLEPLDRTSHPVRPTSPRPVRDPHGRPDAGGGRTTPAGNPPSSARPGIREATAEPSVAAPFREAVPPTALPDVSGDLVGLPDLSALRRAGRRVWDWAVRQVRGAAAVDSQVRARRDEDSAAMLRAGVVPTPFG
jgi:hypothetical protein